MDHEDLVEHAKEERKWRAEHCGPAFARHDNAALELRLRVEALEKAEADRKVSFRALWVVLLGVVAKVLGDWVSHR